LLPHAVFQKQRIILEGSYILSVGLSVFWWKSFL